MSAGLAGCYGRPRPSVNSTAVVKWAGLTAGAPAVVSFSALWCHPCREEIDTLNRAQAEFGASIQFRGFLVEGEEKGSVVKSSDLDQFESFTGEHPQYTLLADPVWRVFDSVHAPFGHSLPTLLLLNGGGSIVQVIQQSLDYDSQLRPLLLALSEGRSVTPVSPKPDPAPVPGQKEWSDSIAAWSARVEVKARPELLAHLTEAWQSGLKKYAFTTAEMPLNSGQIKFLWAEGKENIPESAAWVSDTPVSYCTLNLVLNPDGSLRSSSGNCVQK